MQMQPPSTNGTHPAPRAERGAVAIQPRPAARPAQQAVTRFPAALPGGGLSQWLFTMGRGTFLGFPLLRVLTFVLVFVALTWLLRWLPGSPWVAIALLAAPIVVALAHTAAARRSFVGFTPDVDAVAVVAEPLAAAEKLPVYLWGRLEVQERVRSFVALPGFYRTFATREHACIGLAISKSKLGVAALSDLDAGLWYAFCTPTQLISVRTGSVTWGRMRYPALALAYHVQRAHASGRTQKGVETLYIATADDATRKRILADLTVEEASQRGQIRQHADRHGAQ